MKKQTNLSRRKFFKTSALASGGLLIGFNLFQACKEDVEPPIDLSLLDYNDFNAFIKISNEGKVTIFSPNPEIGQGVKTSMPMLIAEELDVDWKDVHVVQGVLDTKNYTRQVAGGSQSIRLAWEPLRNTGATARQMLVNAAAKRWNTEPSNCTTKSGVVIGPNGEQLSYGEIVNDAAQLPVPEDFKLKDPKDFSIIGTDAINVDLDEIVTGKPLFGLDYKAEGMLYAVVARPPAFGQVIASFDDSYTRQMPNIKDVIKFGDKIAVLATDTWSAIKGKQALKIEWQQDTPAESSLFHDEKLNALLDGESFETLRKDGDIATAFNEADQIIERTYEAPFLPHNCLEPMNFFAHVQTDRIDLVGPIQTPEWTANRVAKLLGREVSEISLQMTRMGGGFGRRLYGDFALEAAEISHLSKSPVKVVFTREDDMTAGTYRPASKYRIKAALKDGKISAYHLKEAAINGNMYGLIPNFFPAGSIDNYQVDVANYKSNITTGAWRAPYTNFLASAEQTFFDELAETLGVERTELHLQLLEKAKANKDDERMEYSPERMEAVVKKIVEVSNWGKTPEGTYQGISIYYCHNTHVAEVVDLELENGFPNIKKVTCVVDCGVVVNPTGAKNQVVGGILDGIGHMMYGELKFINGVPQSNNFNSYQLLRINQVPPEVEVHFIKSNEAPTGLGEPTLPPVGAAIANAIYKATGQRLYKQPYMQNFKAEPLKV